MERDTKPAVVFLRMSQQLREGLRHAADEAGCSLNAFAVQTLAAAAGDPARFRTPAPEPRALPEIERDARGYPIEWRARSEHICARGDFIATMEHEIGGHEMVTLVKRLDAEDPGHFVEWARSRARGAIPSGPDA